MASAEGETPIRIRKKSRDDSRLCRLDSLRHGFSEQYCGQKEVNETPVVCRWKYKLETLSLVWFLPWYFRIGLIVIPLPNTCISCRANALVRSRPAWPASCTNQAIASIGKGRDGGVPCGTGVRPTKQVAPPSFEN